MSKLISLSLILLLVTVQSSSQERSSRLKNVSLAGTITDERTGESLPGATVYLADDRIGVTADPAGHYTISNLPVGHHIIEVSHTGYATRVEHLQVNNDSIVDFKLSSVVVENQGVIVTGVSGATSIRKAPIAVSAIRRAELLQNVSSNIIDGLSRIPGVASLSTGPAISKPFIRGLGFNRVIVVNDGVRQEGQQWGDEHGVEIDEMSVGRVEILKGPASLMYGSDAMAGVINFITNTPVSEGVMKGNLLTHYQSNSGLFALHGNIAGNLNGFNWNVYGSLKSSGDYKNRLDGQVLNSRFKENNYGGYVGLNRPWGYSHLIISQFNQDAGIVEGDRDPATGMFLLYPGTSLDRIAGESDLDSRKVFVPYQEILHRKIVTDNNFVIRKNRLKVNLAFQQNTRKEFGDPENPGDAELHFKLNTLNYNVQWQFPEIKEWHTTFGANGMQQTNRNAGSETLIPEYDLFDLGLFVYAQRFFEKTTLSGGIRYDSRHLSSAELREGSGIRFAKLERNFSNLTGSIGISHEASQRLTFKANIARGFRAPAIAELSSNGTHEGTNRYEYGQPALVSETSWQGDLGADMNYEHFSLSASLFYNRINDFIFYQKLSSTAGGDSLVNVDGEDIPAFQFLQKDASLRGFEISLDLHPHPFHWMHFENSLSFVRGRFDQPSGGSINLPLVPAARLISELRADLPTPKKRIKEAYVKVELEQNFRKTNAFTGFDTETETPGYGILNFGAGTDILDRKKRKTIASLHFAVRNIGDRSYQDHLSRLKYADTNELTGRRGVFNAGRNFSLKMNLPFDLLKKK